MTYKKLVEFAMRSFIEKIINTYIEYLEDAEFSDISKDEIARIGIVLDNFKIWLYIIMNPRNN